MNGRLETALAWLSLLAFSVGFALVLAAWFNLI